VYWIQKIHLGMAGRQQLDRFADPFEPLAKIFPAVTGDENERRSRPQIREFFRHGLVERR